MHDVFMKLQWTTVAIVLTLLAIIVSMDSGRLRTALCRIQLGFAVLNGLFFLGFLWTL